MPSRLIHVAPMSQDFVLFYCRVLFRGITSSLSVHLLIGRLGCFHILAVTSDAAANIGVHTFLGLVHFIFSGKYPEVE